MNSIQLLITYLVTTLQVKSQFPCPPGLGTTETINLASAIVNGDPAITSSLRGNVADMECAATQEPIGWSYTNDGSCNNTDDKVNWYFMGAIMDAGQCSGNPAWYNCFTPDIVGAGPGTGTQECIMAGCLKQISFTLEGTIGGESGIFIKVYTKPTETEMEGANRDCWHKSRLHIAPDAFTPDAINQTFTTPTTFSVDLPGGYASVGTGNAESNTNTENPTLQNVTDNEEIRAIAFSTASNEDRNSHDFILLDFQLTFGANCTCPSVRSYNLADVPGPGTINISDIGNDCSAEIGTCDECTCKYKCIHQDGVDGNFMVINNITSQEACCEQCTSNGGCLGYTYIRDIDGISTMCNESFAIGDCLLYFEKLTACNTDVMQLRYEAVSGSSNDGLCDVNSTVGDCCANTGECLMGQCTLVSSDSPGSESSEEMEGSAESSESSASGASLDSSDAQTVIVPEEESPEVSVSEESYESASGSGSDSGDGALFAKRILYKNKKYKMNNDKETDRIFVMDIGLSMSTWKHVWGIFGVIVVINIVLRCIYYRRQKVSQTLPQHM